MYKRTKPGYQAGLSSLCKLGPEDTVQWDYGAAGPKVNRLITLRNSTDKALNSAVTNSTSP